MAIKELDDKIKQTKLQVGRDWIKVILESHSTSLVKILGASNKSSTTKI